MGSRLSLSFGVLLTGVTAMLGSVVLGSAVLGSAPHAAQSPSITDYVVGPQDVLTITS